VLFAFAARAALRQLRSPRPALRLDEAAIEGEFGRERWEHVQNVSVRCRWLSRTPQRRLVLRRRPGTPDPETEAGEYASRFVYGSGMLEDDRLELPLWGSKRKVLDDVRRFYAGPIED
jgi:hypothetical protein